MNHAIFFAPKINNFATEDGFVHSFFAFSLGFPFISSCFRFMYGMELNPLYSINWILTARKEGYCWGAGMNFRIQKGQSKSSLFMPKLSLVGSPD